MPHIPYALWWGVTVCGCKYLVASVRMTGCMRVRPFVPV